MKLLSIAALLVCLQLNGLQAGTIGLKNGDRISGDIKGLKDGILSLETPYAGLVRIDWAQVATISSTSPLRVEFVSGRSSTGTLAAPRPSLLEVRGAATLQGRFSRVVSISQPGEVPPPTGWFNLWHGNFDLGFTITRGNSETSNLAINFKPTRKTSRDRLSLEFQSLRSVQDGEVSSNLLRTRGRYDRFLSPRAFLFATGGIEKDERADLDLRTTEGGGFGVQLTPHSDTQLSLFGGVTFLQEQFSGEPRALNAQGLLGAEIDSKLFSPLTFSSKGQFLPILSDGRYRLEWDATLRIPLFKGFNFGIQIFDNFDSRPPDPGIKRNDFGILSNLGLAF